MKKKTLAQWLDEDFLVSKSNLVIYETEKRRFELDRVHDLAQRFELDGEVQSDDHTHVLSQGDRVLITYKASGAFFYNDNGKLQRPEYVPELPSAAQAEEIAVNFLKKNEWWPEGAILDSVQLGQLERVEGKKRETRSVHPNHLCVNFRFAVGRLKTYGPGAKIKVFLGHEGEIIGLFYSLRPFRRYAEYPQLPRADLAEALSRKLNAPLDKVEVEDVTLAYFCESPLLVSRFVQPVFIFKLSTPIKSNHSKEHTALEFEMHPLPATTFAPIALIDAEESRMTLKRDQPLTLSCKIVGGTRPFKFSWDSDLDGHLSDERLLQVDKLSIAHRAGRLTAHTIKVTVTDQLGGQDTHQIAVKVIPGQEAQVLANPPAPPVPNDPYVGVEWCNLYHGSAPDISGTAASAQGFKNKMQSLPAWSSRFDWGNDAAWEQDFKHAGAPGGGTDSYWVDNVHFAFFAGHGSSGSFWFGSEFDDHEQRAQDSRWGDGLLNWIVLHACQTMRANFEWDVWCDAFHGLHQMFGFHTTTEGSTPPLGTRFAAWMSFKFFSFTLDMQAAWRLACTECYDASMEYAVIYANQTGTDTQNDHLPGYGHVSADPTAPWMWSYYKETC